MTPFAKAIDTFAGPHTVRFEHDWYQPIEQQIEITVNPLDRAQSLSVDFEKQGTLVMGKHKPVAAP